MALRLTAIFRGINRSPLFGGDAVCLESVCQCENGSLQLHAPIKEALQGVLKVSLNERGAVFKMLRR